MIKKLLAFTCLTLSIGANATVCLVTDNGIGTADMPPQCEYTGDNWLITNELPPGTTIELTPILRNFVLGDPFGLSPVAIPPGNLEGAGGSLGGTVSSFTAEMEFSVSGTGSLDSFNRTLVIQSYVVFENGPRTPGDATQQFDSEIYLLQGDLFGDPDFDILSIRAGDTLGLPSPGMTTMLRDGPPGSDFYVDSFFDITYQIEFQGAPGSVLEGLAGVTEGTSRMQTEVPEVPIPAAAWLFGSALLGLGVVKRKKA
jgi:hypothetical protein